MNQKNNGNTANNQNNATEAVKLNVEFARGLETASTPNALKAMLSQLNLQPGVKLRELLKSSSARKRYIIMTIILIIMGVFGFFAQAGADYIMDNGRLISIFVTLVGATFVVLTATKAFSAQLKWAVVVAELCLMTFNAYVMPGYFGAASIGTQGEKLLADEVKEANKVVEQIGTFYTTNNTVGSAAKNIAAIEEKRDGKGVMYETATNIANTFPTLEMPKDIVAPTLNKDIMSLSQMNEELLKAQESISKQVRGYVQKAEGVRKAAEGTVEQVSKIASMPLSSQQHANAVALEANMKNLTKFAFNYQDKTVTLQKKDLSIDGYMRVLPFILDGLVIMFMIWLVLTVYAGSETFMTGAIHESRKIVLEKILQGMKIKFQKSDVLAEEDDFNAVQFLEENSSFIPILNRQSKTYANLKDLLEVCTQQELISYAENGATKFTLDGLLNLKNDDAGSHVVAADIIEKISSKDWELLKTVVDDPADVIDFEKEKLQCVMQVIKALKPKFAGDANKLKKYMTKVLAKLSADTELEVFAVWSELVDGIEQQERLEKVSATLLYALKEDVVQEFIELLKNLRDNEKAIDIIENWSKEYSKYLQEWKNKSLYNSTLRSIMKFTAKGGAATIAKAFSSYEHKVNNMGGVSTLQDSSVKVNDDAQYYTDLMSLNDPKELIQKLEDLFVVKS